MSMFPCPTCKNKVSYKANACPKCGHPFTDKEKKELAAAQNRQQVGGCIGCLVLVILFGMIISRSGRDSGSSSTGAGATSAAPRLAASGPERVEGLCSKVGEFSVTCFDSKGNPVVGNPTGAFEVIANAPLRHYSDCRVAKMEAYEVLKALYSDGAVKGSLTRVLVTAPPYVRVSLGGEDGRNLTNGGSWSGPTNFFKVTAQYRNYEYEKGPFSKRTWVEMKGCQ